jgi:DMSO/TMAO reductase YedYZ molybdopterin-dependent catalytic subunit
MGRRDLDSGLIVKDALRSLERPTRRLFTKQLLTLGGLSLLTGCTLTDDKSVEAMLRRISRFNDRAQAWLFDPHRRAPSYAESMMTRPFPFNAYYDLDQVPDIDVASYRLRVKGLATGKREWTLDELTGLARTNQITRLICIEGWSAIGKWGGTPLASFLQRAGADLTAKYVLFECADDYSTSIDMPTALHPQTLLTVTYDGQPLPPKYGFPLRIRIPTKLGFKNPKHVTAMTITNSYPGGYWENQGYNWFSGS